MSHGLGILSLPSGRDLVLRIHRAERADRLVEELATVVAHPLDDPLAIEMVAVHSRGIERWLAQELSARLGTAPGRGDGVCANVEFPFPAWVVGRALAAAGDLDPDADPWSPERLVWPLLEVLGENAAAGWLEPVRPQVGGTEDDPTAGGRRFGAVRHVADLFDRYGVHRPAMVRAWANERDVDGAGRPLEADRAWQPKLWRLVAGRLRPVRSPAERLDDAVARLRDGLEVPDLPPRLSLFGLTALPASYLAVLSALAATRDVHLFLLHPSPSLWSAVAGRVGHPPASPPRRDDDPTRDLPRHPLLASWGRDARELQLVVAAADGGGAPDATDGAPDATDGALSVGDTHAPPDVSLLARLQEDIRADLPPPGRPLAGRDDRRPPLQPDDRSVRVHACHGHTRQVEVLRDAILHLLADDPTLEPRDVIVMCPDIETFAPIVHAVFGAHAVVDDSAAGGAAADGPPDLRVRLADRAIRQTNPVLRVVAETLALADGRLTASDVLDLASREPVRRRFRFDDDDLDTLDAWVAGAGIRWGLDGEHRGAFGLDGVAANTWRTGLDRILLGVAMADEDQRLVGGTCPLDVEGDGVDLAGRLAEYVDRLAGALADLTGPRPVAAWRAAIAAVADALTATTERDRWQNLQLHRLMDDVVAEATTDGAPSPVPLTLPEVRSLLDDRLRGRPTRANHRTGDLTVCTLVPMRSVPHRVVCLLGMDDGAFPRRTAPDGDDLIERDPHVGDRDLRSEDRQLLLDALLAAGDALVVTYTGRDERTNEPRPPAVPIGELLDAVDRTVRTGAVDRDGLEEPARHRVVVHHPLQPFDERNFRAGALEGDSHPRRPWSFDPAALAGARARARSERTAQRFAHGRLPAPDDGATVDLAELVRFLEHPVKAFLRQRLGVVLSTVDDQAPDAIPVELSPLERFAVGDRLLQARLAGVDLDRWRQVERARGSLPPGALATSLLDDVTATVGDILAVADAHADRHATSASLDVTVPLEGGRTLTGMVGGVVGDVLLTVQYSRVGAKHRLAAWARLLAATAAHPDRALRAVTVGRSSDRRAVVRCARIPPLATSAGARRRHALGHLARLVDLFDRGMREPLPLYCDTSAAYAQAARDADADAVQAAADVWTTGNQPWPNEDRHPEHLLVLGDVVPFDLLCDDLARQDEDRDGWPGDERTRVGRYARRLWDPLLAVEQVDDR
ncbi:MAG TPA: exodeoxyribonuclease V subunit gamma [Nitriliruptorales bacterium]|nr:exodeoxyribonuclease V subunit gamma [Nitriliruptorales bacterium]